MDDRLDRRVGMPVRHDEEDGIRTDRLVLLVPQGEPLRAVLVGALADDDQRRRRRRRELLESLVELPEEPEPQEEPAAAAENPLVG